MRFVEQRVGLLVNSLHPRLDDWAALVQAFLQHRVQLHQFARTEDVGHGDDVAGEERRVAQEVALQVLDDFPHGFSPLGDLVLVHGFPGSSGDDQLVMKRKRIA